MKNLVLPLVLLVLAILACARPGQTEIIYVTATFPNGERVLTGSPTPDEPTDTPIVPTPNATRSNVSNEPLQVNIPSAAEGGGSYTVQTGDILAVIARESGTTVDAILAANNLANPNLIYPGQVLTIPSSAIQPTEIAQALVQEPVTAPNFKIIPDSELVYSPGVADFDVVAYMKLKKGFLRAYSEEVGEGNYATGVELLNEVAQNYSVNPRLLLALLDYKSGWIESPTITENAQTYPLGLYTAGRTGLYKQLLDAANLLNAGYYGWKYRGFSTLTFADGRTITLAPDINAGTAAVQYFLSQYQTYDLWLADISAEGFFQHYLAMFGDPFLKAYEPILPLNLTQPAFSFPFPANETWYFTGGPHGGYNTGSAWSSIDFAPPAPPDTLLAEQGYCYVSPFWVTAVAPGVIARSGGGFVILDLDFDGNEYTGWTVIYLHLAEGADLVTAGTRVEVGDRLGHPSCTGGFSSATHLHFGRRYNGEWIPIDCFNCPADVPHVPMVLSGWTVSGFENQEYQGTMSAADGGFRRAEQGRGDPINELRYNK